MLIAMSDHLRDPDLDQLVRQLNQGNLSNSPGDGEAELLLEPLDESQGPSFLPALALRTSSQILVTAEEPLDRFLAEMIQQKASDLHLISGMPPIFRVNGRLLRSEERSPLEGDEIHRLFQPHLGAKERQDLEERGSTDFSLSISRGRIVAEGMSSAWRFRVNVHRQRGEPAAAVRALPSEVPTLAGLNLPAQLADLVKPNRGLVLVCGPTGSGKSSTLAALVGEINRTRTSHIVTIEDPIEFEHRSVHSAIEHIEVGRDTRSFEEALRASLRQDPDVILVGEMRDLETVATALTAAETGHLVLSTLHTNDAQQAVHRMIDVFPPAQQSQIRHQLALALHAIVVQTLVPRADGRGRVPAIELLLANYPVRHHIRSDHTQKLYNEITLGKRQGMISMEESLALLVRQGAIDVEEARMRASHPDAFESFVRV
jgi:twitching motility protein PilT